MAFKVVHSENYYFKEEMNELLHYHQNKMLYVKPRMLEKAKAFGPFTIFTLLWMKVKTFQYIRWFPTVNVTKKVERTNQKQFSIRKLPLFRKILSLKCSFWNSLRGKKDMATHTLMCIHYTQYFLHLSLPIQSVCTYLMSHILFDGYEHASTTSTYGTECLMHIQCLPGNESFDENLENKY